MKPASTAAGNFLQRNAALAVAGSAAYTMSTLFSAMKPVLLTRFIEQVGYAESLAGIIVAMPFVGIACASLLMQPRLLALPYAGVVTLFGGGLILLEWISVLVYEQALVILTAQFFSGICVGVLMGVTSRLIVLTSSAEKLFGFVDMTAVLLMSGMVYGIGRAVANSGLTGGYGFATAAAVVLTIAMFTLRGGAAMHSTTQLQAPALRISMRPVAVILMGVLFVTSSGLGFAFMFTLARNLGMNYDAAGTQIGVLLFLSALACQAGGWAAARYGHTRPLAGAFICCAAGWYFAVHATDPVLFLLALVPAIFALQFNYPILLALCGSLDSHGRWAAIATPLLTSGFAWAAICAGLIVSAWDLSALATGTAAGMFVCLILLGLTHAATGRSEHS